MLPDLSKLEGLIRQVAKEEGQEEEEGGNVFCA